MPRYERHVFICVNERPAGHARGSCAARGAVAIRERFKAEVRRRGLAATVRANQCGCLDACELGPTVVVYPEQVWYGGVTLADVDEIIESHLERGVPVRRLMIPDGGFPAGESGRG